MTNELKIFNNPEFGTVRTLEINGEPWVMAADVCKAFGVTNGRNITARLDEDDKAVYSVDTLGGKQNVTFVNESGLYNMLLSMNPNKAKARGMTDDEISYRQNQLKKFKRWITHEVLPSIRKNGGYIAGQEEMTPAEIMAKAVLLAQKTIADREARIAALTEENAILIPKGEYFDELVDVNSLMNFTDTAKALGISRKKMLDILIKEKYLYRQGSYGKLIPYEKNNHGYFEVKEQKNAFGSWAGPQTFVTVAGRQLLLQMRDEGYFD